MHDFDIPFCSKNASVVFWISIQSLKETLCKYWRGHWSSQADRNIFTSLNWFFSKLLKWSFNLITQLAVGIWPQLLHISQEPRGLFFSGWLAIFPANYSSGIWCLWPYYWRNFKLTFLTLAAFLETRLQSIGKLLFADRPQYSNNFQLAL